VSRCQAGRWARQEATPPAPPPGHRTGSAVPGLHDRPTRDRRGRALVAHRRARRDARL